MPPKYSGGGVSRGCSPCQAAGVGSAHLSVCGQASEDVFPNSPPWCLSGAASHHGSGFFQGEKHARKKPACFCFKLFNLLFTALGLRHCAQGFSSCGKRGLLGRMWVSHCGGFSWCGARAPGSQALQLWSTGLVAPWHVGPSQTRDRTCVPLHWQADALSPDHQGSAEKPVFCNLVSDMAGHHFCVLFLKGRSASPAHTSGKGRPWGVNSRK